MTNYTYISCADTAKMIRTALKSAFPGIVFSVRSKTYSMGASIDISWTDGPSADQVSAITNRFEGASFDGSIDLKSYKHHARLASGEIVILEGALPEGAEELHFAADYIFTHRSFTKGFLEKVAARESARWGVAVPEVQETSFGAHYVSDWANKVGGGSFSIDELCQQLAHKTIQFQNAFIFPKG